MNIVEIKLEAITDPNFQPRDKLEAAGIEALAASIDEIGLINPIVVRKKNGGYELIAGTRRCHAFMMLGKEYIPAKIIEQDSREAAMLQLSENFHRQDLNPIQNAKMLKFMLDELEYSTTELAKFCSRSKEWISRQLGLLDMDSELQQAVEEGQLSASVAMELRTIPDKKLRLDYVNYAIAGGCTEKAARSWAAQAKAVVAAREARQQTSQDAAHGEGEEPLGPAEPRCCILCQAPEDKVVIEDWPICWHCGQKLKPQS